MSSKKPAVREEDLRRIEEIIGKMSCPKGFICAATGFENLCQARDFGVDRYLACLEENRSRCKFSLPFADIYLCQCPLRVFLAKRLGR